jgi:hypothetical protein
MLCIVYGFIRCVCVLGVFLFLLAGVRKQDETLPADNEHSKQALTFPAPVPPPSPMKVMRSLAEVIEYICVDIEKLKPLYPQLDEFTASKHCDSQQLQISYAFHTHQAEGRGGWTSGVPNPDNDGIWFYIDFHDANSMAQIHTQPVTAPLHFRDKVVSFLILEGADSKPLAAELYKILKTRGVRDGLGRLRNP